MINANQIAEATAWKNTKLIDIDGRSWRFTSNSRPLVISPMREKGVIFWTVQAR